MSKPILTQNYVKKLFNYDGINLRWKVKKAMRIKINSIAGSVNSEGYRHIEIEGKKYKAHRIIWLYVYGVMPEREIDHINRQKLDNRIENLRESNRQINSRNRSAGSNSLTGVRGVYWQANCKKWVSVIGVGNGKRVTLGYYNDIEEAISMRLTAECHYGY